MSWCSRKKKESIFCTVFCILSEFFFNICTSSQCTVYRIHFQNIYTFTYQKTFLQTFLCLFLKSPKALIVSLKPITTSTKRSFLDLWRLMTLFLRCMFSTLYCYHQKCLLKPLILVEKSLYTLKQTYRQKTTCLFK